jgi:hypothetical protein
VEASFNKTQSSLLSEQEAKDPSHNCTRFHLTH